MPVAPSLRASVSRFVPRGLRPLSNAGTPGQPAGDDRRSSRRARTGFITWVMVAVASLLLAGVASAQTPLEIRVAASLDDAEQFADSSMYYNSSDLELIHDTSDQIVGMRWANLAIPAGSTITAAWI